MARMTVTVTLSMDIDTERRAYLAVQQMTQHYARMSNRMADITLVDSEVTETFSDDEDSE